MVVVVVRWWRGAVPTVRCACPLPIVYRRRHSRWATVLAGRWETRRRGMQGRGGGRGGGGGGGDGRGGVRGGAPDDRDRSRPQRGGPTATTATRPTTTPWSWKDEVRRGRHRRRRRRGRRGGERREGQECGRGGQRCRLLLLLLLLWWRWWSTTTAFPVVSSVSVSMTSSSSGFGVREAAHVSRLWRGRADGRGIDYRRRSGWWRGRTDVLASRTIGMGTEKGRQRLGGTATHCRCIGMTTTSIPMTTRSMLLLSCRLGHHCRAWLKGGGGGGGHRFFLCHTPRRDHGGHGGREDRGGGGPVVHFSPTLSTTGARWCHPDRGERGVGRHRQAARHRHPLPPRTTSHNGYRWWWWWRRSGRMLAMTMMVTMMVVAVVAGGRIPSRGGGWCFLVVVVLRRRCGGRKGKEEEGGRRRRIGALLGMVRRTVPSFHASFVFVWEAPLSRLSTGLSSWPSLAFRCTSSPAWRCRWIRWGGGGRGG